MWGPLKQRCKRQRRSVAPPSREEKKKWSLPAQFFSMTTASIAKSSSGAHAAAPAPAPAPPRDVSISIVKASQREHVISRLWPEFVKVRRERERNKLQTTASPPLFSFNPDLFSFPLTSLPKKKKKYNAQSQRLKHADPTRASTAALSLFVARLLAG